MANENTVTIPIDEYFDLRQKAEMNAFLMGQLREIEHRFHKYEDELFRLDDEIRRLKDGK
jgi:hypothetical protein